MCRCVCTVTLVFRLFILPCTMANHGGLTPPALALRCECLPAKKRFLRCTNVHSTKSGGRQPAVGGEMRIGGHERRSSADRRRCVDRRCGRGHRGHGANVAPESFMGHTAPDYNRVHWRHGGLTPPALALRCERLPAKKTIFAVHKRTFDQERRALARRGLQYQRCAGRIADRAATNEETTKSGGRQPTVVRKPPLQQRSSMAG
jgi:hypothetical protein